MATTTVVVPRSAGQRKQGKKHRKHGRKNRRPGHKRYNEEKRWLINKAKRIFKNNGEEALEAFCDKHTLTRKSLGF